jgi:uncharacterized protein YbjT (DUF2867 family)
MEGSSKDWKKFEERDRAIAKNFADAASICKVKRIIYLGGLTNEKDPAKLSPHMRSRMEVGEILSQSTASVTIFRAAVILGYGGGSFEMLSYLVDRLPLMVCPKWVLTRSQPIAVDDVVAYLANAVDVDATMGRTFDIGGPDKLTYLDMMKHYAEITDKSIRIIIVPFLTPRLSSYWVDLVTPVRAALARPLIDSLKHEALVEDDSIRKIIPLRLASFEEAIKQAKTDEIQRKEFPKLIASAVGFPVTSAASISALVAVTLLNTGMLQTSEALIAALQLVGLMYIASVNSSFFLVKGARLGSLLAGVLLWLTVGVTVLETYVISGFFLQPNSLLVAESIPLLIGITAAHVRFRRNRTLSSPVYPHFFPFK